MKKFLTVLLALSVVFTYTVGTAFAADPVGGDGTTYTEKLAQAKNELSTELNSTKSSVVTGLADEYKQTVEGSVEIKIAKSVYEKVAEDIYADYKNVLDDAASQLKDDESLKDSTVAQIKTALSAKAAISEGLKDKKLDDVLDKDAYKAFVLSSGSETPYLQNTYEYAFAAEKDRVIGELNKIDLTLYTNDVIDPVNDAYKTTHSQLATQVKQLLIDEAGTYAIQSGEEATGIATKIVALNKLVSEYADVVTTGLDSTVLTYKLKKVKKTLTNTAANVDTTKLLTKEEIKTGDTSLGAKKAQAKADVASEAAKYYADAVKDSGATTASIAAAKAEADAYLEVMNARIDDMKAIADGFSAPTIGDKDNGKTYAAVKKIYDDFADKIAIYKVKVDATGRLVYDATKLDEILADAKSEIYDGDILYALADLDDRLAAAEVGAEDLEWTKEKAVASMKDKLEAKLYKKDGSCKYYDIEKAKIEAKYNEVIDKINAATTIGQVTQVALEPNTASIHEKDGIVNDIKGLTKYGDELKKVQAYADYANTGLYSWQDGYKVFSTNDLAKFYAEKGARTNAEIQALLSEAKAMVEALLTNKEAAEKKAALEAQIKALPNAITLADKDAVKAAYDAREESGITPDNNTRLVSAIEAVRLAEKKVIDDMFDALPAVSKITTANKDAVKAIAEAVKAYDATMMYASLYDTNSPTALEKYQKAVRDADQSAVVAAITALPDNPTPAQIKAVREQYDAFVKEYQDPLTGFDARKIVNIDKLLYAEAQAKANEIKAVEALKITASSVAGKGYIKVKWTVKGDAAAADGYQVYRSTKRNSGFGTKPYFTTKNKTYKNTKSLKKGTRYYYKVRAYKVVDGKNVYSDWSNKAYRIAK